MEVTRIFHPVGQGGFYTESFDNQHMVVYDCGGKSRVFMEEYINSFLSEIPKQPIEAVFISHLHEDHINGLQHLIDKTKVRRIFLPQLTKEKVLDVLLYNALHSSKINSNDFIINFIDAIRLEREFKNVAVIQVQESEMRERPNIDSISIDSPLTQISPSLPSGTPLTFNNNLWYYIPYNPVSPSLSFDKILDEKIRETLINIYNDPSAKSQAEKIAELMKDKGIEVCKNAYAKLFGRIHNSQSMPVFSGLLNPRGTTTTIEIGHVSNPIELIRLIKHIYTDNHNCDLELLANIENNSYHSIFHCHSHMIHCRRACNIITNFLYTGDFEAGNVISLKNYFIGHLWNSICGIQIPHHGSRHNYTPNLYSGKLYAVASAGIRNKYHHPNIDTLTNIAANECFPFVVTEDVKTAIYQHFKIK